MTPYIDGLPEPDGDAIPASQAVVGVWYLDDDDWWVRPLGNGRAQWFAVSGSFEEALPERMTLWRATNQNPKIEDAR